MGDSLHRTPSREESSSLRHGQAEVSPAPHPRLRATCGERSRLEAGGGGSARPPTPRSPSSTAKAGEAGGGELQTCQPGDCPSHGSECRWCVRGERTVPKLRRCPGAGCARFRSGVAAAAAQLQGPVSPGGSDRPRAEPSGSTGGGWEAGEGETGLGEPAARRRRNEARERAQPSGRDLAEGL